MAGEVEWERPKGKGSRGVQQRLDQTIRFLELERVRTHNLRKVLKQIQATCGHPDPAEACRIILKIVKEELK